MKTQDLKYVEVPELGIRITPEQQFNGEKYSDILGKVAEEEIATYEMLQKIRNIAFESNWERYPFTKQLRVFVPNTDGLSKENGHVGVLVAHSDRVVLNYGWFPAVRGDADRGVFLYEKIITEAPELLESIKLLTPKVQSEEEKEKRLSDWKELLNKIPYCYLEKWPGGFIEHSPFLTEAVESDIDNLFWDSIFVVMTYAENLQKHNESYYGLYFCFLMNGKFKIESDGNYEGTDAKDSIADILLEYENWNGPHKEESWEAGYRLIIKIIEKAYRTGISEIPRID